MSIRKRVKAKQNLYRQIWKLFSTVFKRLMKWLQRGLLAKGRRTRHSRAGFVLPTTVLLLLVVTLTITALVARTSSRTNQVIWEREGKEISNAASPAIDRAKAKLEYLFNGDTRLPNGVPDQDRLVQLLNENSRYLFNGETRLDINGGGADNAWSYRADIDGDPQTGQADGTDATIAYSIVGQIPSNQNDLFDQTVNAVNTRANSLLVRNGPVSSTQTSTACQQNQQNNAQVEDGWFVRSDNTAVLRKNFQINALVISDQALPNSTRRTVATLELQQDRQLDRGNKWGAWFRNDIELTQPPIFNWNGAMHTEGSVFVGGNNNFTAYLLSAPSSCVFSRTASEITNAETTNDQNQIDFQGQVVSGAVANNSISNNTNRFHFLDQNYQPVAGVNDTRTHITPGTDSVVDSITPSNIALDPVEIFTRDKTKANGYTTNWNTVRDSNWQNRDLFTNRRIYNQREPKPYVDDTYRADNRYGPKPTYSRDSSLTIPAGQRVGNPIDSSTTPNNLFLNNLVSNVPLSSNIENLGLDGYWERRARREGLRVIVGQRLELGAPLAPPTSGNHQARQRRALRDNLAAVQATAIYHRENNNVDFPVACLATTVHPGTAETLKRSATFEEITFTKVGGSNETIVYSDFFTGRGTNGWEYAVPDAATFPNSYMLKTLQNLANFTGDPFGAFPPRQDSSTSQAVPAAGQATHPYPELARSGDFSNLRLALNNLATSGYDNLSIADQSYLHTASCTLGMLANNIKLLQDFSYLNNTSLLSALDGVLKAVPASATSPEQVIAALADQNQARLARAVYLKEQVERDRRNGVGSICLAAEFGSTNTTGGTPGSGLARLCPTGVRYSALYYIFPITDHGEYETARTSNAYINSVNSTALYKAIAGTGTVYVAALDDAALESIRLRPRTIGAGGTWTLGRAVISSPGSNAPNDSQIPLIRHVNTSGTPTVYRIPFKDTALFNGREMMSSQVLDIDLHMLRRYALNINTSDPADHWLPQTGIVYAFREDAVREDGIARPAGTNMNAATPRDPTIPPTGNGITTKPVDFLPDPDRRPYGFRLKNGADLTRTTLALDDENNLRGVSFISDNPVYIQGNFNLHSTNGNTNDLEEFTQTLLVDYSNFYTRSTIESRFARPSDDRWRPSEIIADAVSILSNNFCDGSIADSFTTAGTGSSATVSLAQYGCGTGNAQTSYLNQNRPSTVVSDWLRENPFDSESPIRIDANGNPLRTSGSYGGSYYLFSNTKPLRNAAQTRINSIIVSGLVPSRANQFNGGLHNFPRFLENWNETTRLNIAGALIQLNFSTYATAPWDQDAWEPGDTPITTYVYPYYIPPLRLWGYDVALQLAPAGPVARRFVSANNTRSEFYRELPLDDPYIQNLRCAGPVGSTTNIDPTATCP